MRSRNASIGASSSRKEWAKQGIATALKLSMRVWIMMRDQIDSPEFCRRGPLRRKGTASITFLSSRIGSARVLDRLMVPGTGLEPARLSAHGPKPCASANSAIPAPFVDS